MFKSLTRKFIFISIILLTFLSVFIFAGFKFTRLIDGEARRINLAGKERMLTLDITSHMHFIASNTYPAYNELHKKDIEKELVEYEAILYGIRDGSDKLGLTPMHKHDRDSMSHINLLIDLWENTQKPTIKSVMDFPVENKEVACNKCHQAIRENFDKVEELVNLLEKHNDDEIKAFNNLRVYVLGFFLIALLSTILFVRRSIVLPARRLKDAALEIEKGNFNVRTEVKTKDDIGMLGNTFNHMASTLGQLFSENEEHLRELNILNEISGVASRSLTLEVMLDMVIDSILNLKPLKLEKKGAIFLCDEKEKSLKLVVSRNFPDEQKRGCALVPYGECLCGISADKGEILISESSVEDKRHSKVYSDAKEHGHIILPLKSRDKKIGILCLYLQAGKKLSGREEKLYTSMADIISVSMQNAINHRQVAMLAKSLESSLDIIIITDTEGKIIYINPATEKQLGYTNDELLGHMTSVIQSKDNPFGIWEKIYSKTLEGGWAGEVINKRKDGQEFPVLLTTSPVKDSDGNIIALIGISRDITKQKRAEKIIRQSKEQLEAIIDNSTAIIYLKDLQGKYILVNRRFEELFHITNKQIAGKTDHDMFPKEMADAFRENDKKVLETGIPIEFEEVAPQDGRLYTYISVKFLLNDSSGNPYAICGISTDITERKTTEERIEINYQIQHILNSLLRTSMEDLELPKLLEIALDTILGAPFLKLMPKGGIFLVDDDIPDVLVLKANRNLPVPLQGMCATVPFSRCLCGRAAANREIQFADCLDDRHENQYEGIPPHGHYNVPILSKGRVLGVFVLYLLEGHQQKIEEIEFLLAVADTLAGLIERKKSEEALLIHSKELFALADSSNSISAISLTENIYEGICNLAVRKFGLEMTWIGMIEAGNYNVRPVSQSGSGEDYLSAIKVTWDDSPIGMGPVGTAIKTKGYWAMQHIDTDPAFAPWREEALKRGYRSILSVSMINSNADVIGAISFYSSAPGYFTKRRISIFNVFANYATVAIEHRKFIEDLEEIVKERTGELEKSWNQLKEHEKRLKKLYEISYTRKPDSKEFIKFLLEEIAEMMDIDSVVFGKIINGKCQVYAAAKKGSLNIKEGALFTLDEGLCVDVISSKDPLIISDASKSEHFKNHPAFTKHKAGAYLGVPVFVRDNFYGTFCLINNNPYNFNEDHLNLLQLLAKRIEYEITREEYEKEIENSRLQAETSNRAKSDFLANMSHELRTPLNSIIGFSQLMIDRMEGITANEQKEYMTDIYDSGKHLLALINDVLDLSKVEAGKMELDLSEFDLKELIDRCLDMLREKVLKHSIMLKFEVEEEIGAITADERKIKQVLFNLLSNAVKFTLDGGSIIVHARTLSDDLIEISVADTGIGISEEDQAKLFQPFQQLESPMLKKRPGTGLGLNLCRQLVNLHGGRIWVESESDKGSKFIFVIPREVKHPVEQKIIDPLRRVLTWNHFLSHLERFISFHKRNNRQLGLMKVTFHEINRPEDHVSIVKVLKDKIRKYEVITYNEDNYSYYIMLLDADRPAVDQAAIRISTVLKENGHPNIIKAALSMEDGESVGKLLKALNK